MKWITAINEALNNASPIQSVGSTHDPIMHTFEKPKHCAACNKLLKGIFYQGYRCTKCQVGVHRDCIPGLPTCGMLHPPQLPPRPQDFNRISIPLPKPIPLESMDEDLDEAIRPRTPRQESESSLLSVCSNGNNNSIPSMPPLPSGLSIDNGTRYKHFTIILLCQELYIINGNKSIANNISYDFFLFQALDPGPS